MKADGWTPIILSGGFAPLIRPLADALGIAHVEAVPLHFHPDGSYAGYGEDYPTTRNGGKPEVIREWKQAMLPEVVVMMGDGISDLEAKPEVDLFIGFGGVVSFEVAGDLDAASRVVDACTIPYIAASLGGVESLIEQPAIMSFYELTSEERLQIGIKDNLIRYAVGIEDADDLIADLSQALDRAL